MSDRLREAQSELRAMRDEINDRDPTLFDQFDDDMDAAIESVTDHAGPVFRELALDAVRRAARCNHTLTVTDAVMRCTDPDCETLDARAWGGIMRRARDLGWIVSTGNYKPSTVPAHHGRPMLIWRSNIVEDHGTNFEIVSKPAVR
jgi:hypothetical protein